MKIIKVSLIALLLIGGTFMFYSYKLPYYTDVLAKQKLDMEMGTHLGGVNYKHYKDEYYKNLARLTTNKTAYMDLGSGFAIASSILLGFIWLKKLKTFGELDSVRSLSKIWIFISANLVWLLLIPGTYFYYEYRAERGDYPWFADSIAIPIFSETIVLVIGIFFLNLFLMLTSIGSVFPTPLFKKSSANQKNYIGWEIFWWVCILINIVILLSCIIGGDHVSIPINLFFIYILLSLRAGKINSYKFDNHASPSTNQ